MSENYQLGGLKRQLSQDCCQRPYSNAHKRLARKFGRGHENEVCLRKEIIKSRVADHTVRGAANQS